MGHGKLQEIILRRRQAVLGPCQNGCFEWATTLVFLAEAVVPRTLK